MLAQRHRHVVVNLNAQPCPVLEKPHNVDGALHVPAVEEAPHERRPEGDGIERLHEVRVVQPALVDTAAVRRARA